MTIERYTERPQNIEYLVVDETTTIVDIRNWVWACVGISVDESSGAVLVSGTPANVGDRVGRGGDVRTEMPEGMQLLTVTNPVYLIGEKQ